MCFLARTFSILAAISTTSAYALTHHPMSASVIFRRTITPRNVVPLRIVHIASHPVAIAIDAASGHVFVLSQGPGDPNNYDEPIGHASVIV